MSLREEVEREFAQRFGAAPPFVTRAPGRVNLIGEHTDYNDGFVLPMAIDREIRIAFRPRQDRRVIVYSREYAETRGFDLDTLTRGEPGWIEYVKGVAWALQERGHHLQGFEGVVSGDVPRGAGLSSSAALELAAMRAFAALNQTPWSATHAALAGQRVENEWVGVNSGIMDQMIVACAQRGHAMLLDCRSLEATHVPMPAGIAVVILDTGTRRGLVGSAYNERRRQCEEASALFGVAALRDVTLEQLSARQHQLNELTYRRARHVVSENERTRAAAEALSNHDPVRLGQLMQASHASLRDDFNVTNAALDTIVAIAQAEPACFGTRMTGAGFGGCAVAIVEKDAADQFIENVTHGYQRQTNLEPRAYVCRAAGGATLETETSMESVPS